MINNTRIDVLPNRFITDLIYTRQDKVSTLQHDFRPQTSVLVHILLRDVIDTQPRAAAEYRFIRLVCGSRRRADNRIALLYIIYRAARARERRCLCVSLLQRARRERKVQHEAIFGRHCDDFRNAHGLVWDFVHAATRMIARMRAYCITY